MGFSGQRVIGTMAKLGTGLVKMRQNIATANEEWKVATSLQKEYEVFITGTWSQLKILGQQISAVGLRIGNDMLPVIKELIRDLQEDLVPFLETLAEKFLENKDAIGELVKGGYEKFKNVSKELIEVMKNLAPFVKSIFAIVHKQIKVFNDNPIIFSGLGLVGYAFFGKLGAVATMSALAAAKVGYDKLISVTEKKLIATTQIETLAAEIEDLKWQIEHWHKEGVVKRFFKLFSLSSMKTVGIDDLKAKLVLAKQAYKQLLEDMKKEAKGHREHEAIHRQEDLKKSIVISTNIAKEKIAIEVKTNSTILEATKTLTKKELKVKAAALKQNLRLWTDAKDEHSSLQSALKGIELDRIVAILKEEELSIGERAYLITEMTSIVETQQGLQISAVKQGYDDKIRAAKNGSDYERQLIINKTDAIKLIEAQTTDKINNLKEAVTRKSFAELLEQVNDVTLSAAERIKINTELNNKLDAEDTKYFDAFAIGMASQALTAKSVNQQIADFGTQTYQTLQSGFKTIFSDFIKGDFSNIGDTFKSMLSSMASNFASTLASMAAQWAAAKLWDWGSTLFFGEGGEIPEDGWFRGNAGELVLNKVATEGLKKLIGESGVSNLLATGYANYLGGAGQTSITMAAGGKDYLNVGTEIGDTWASGTSAGKGAGGSAASAGVAAGISFVFGLNDPTAGTASAAGAIIGSFTPLGPVGGAIIGGALGKIFGGDEPKDPVLKYMEENMGALTSDINAVASFYSSLYQPQNADYLERKGDAINKRMLQRVLRMSSDAHMVGTGQIMQSYVPNYGDIAAKMAVERVSQYIGNDVFGENDMRKAKDLNALLGGSTAKVVQSIFDRDMEISRGGEGDSMLRGRTEEGSWNIDREYLKYMTNNFGTVSFGKGVDFIPSNMFANVHRGERIISSDQNKVLTDFIEGIQKFGGKGGGGTTVILKVENLFASDINTVIDEINSDNQERNIGNFRLMIEEQKTTNFNLENA
jgi:hypothetical protein